jgi:hypothetical protein
MKLIMTLAAAIALSGCTTTGTVPLPLLTCASQPASPTEGTQRDVALYIVDLAEAGADCRTKLGSVRRILTPETNLGNP